MSAHRRTLRACAAAAALLAAACSEGTAPQLLDPQQLSSDLQTVSGVFQTPVFQSFGAIGTAPGSPVASAPAGTLLEAAPVTAPSSPSQAYADAPARLQALRSAASALGSALSAQVIPTPLWGKTFVWDVSTHQYVEDPAQLGPANGIRVILYQVDAIGQVLEPPVPVGRVDLLDESTSSTDRVHVIVQDNSASPVTYADYTVSGSVTLNGSGQVSAFSASATGYVSDGTHRLDFGASFSATNLDTTTPDVQVDVTWDLNAPSVRVELHETLSTPDADHVTLTIDFSVTRGSETLRLAGTVEVDALLQTVTVDLTIYVNGQTFATMSGTNQGIQARRANGSPLSQEELEAIGHMFELPDYLYEVIEHLFRPTEHLMGV